MVVDRGAQAPRPLPAVRPTSADCTSEGRPVELLQQARTVRTMYLTGLLDCLAARGWAAQAMHPHLQKIARQGFVIVKYFANQRILCILHYFSSVLFHSRSLRQTPPAQKIYGRVYRLSRWSSKNALQDGFPSARRTTPSVRSYREDQTVSAPMALSY